MYMNKEAVEMLEKILKKDISLLTSVDKAFLKARRGYLSDEQLEKYAEILSVGTVGEQIPVSTLPEAPEVLLPTYKDLIARGKELGLKVKIGMKREVIQEMITQAEL